VNSHCINELDMSVFFIGIYRLANNMGPGGSAGSTLPKEFLYLYMSNCIVHCEKITSTHKRNWQARLVCVFLLSLFRNHNVEIQVRLHACMSPGPGLESDLTFLSPFSCSGFLNLSASKWKPFVLNLDDFVRQLHFLLI